MTIAIPSDKPLIAIYACGGTGYNLAAKFIDKFMGSELISDRTKVYFVDTSISNNSQHNTDDNTMVVGSGVGSGKKRAVNAEEIRDSLSGVFQSFKPGVFNILLGGASGGSGSTIVNEMFRAFAMREQNVLSMLVGSRSSRTEIENMEKTFTSFARLAKRYEKPALVHYRENTSTAPRSSVDSNMINDLGVLCLFLSGHDDKMDVTDIHHLFEYQKITGFQPNVTSFELFIDKFDPKPHEVVYAVGTLAREDVSTDVEPRPEYQVAGFVRKDNDEVMGPFQVIHWAVLGNSFSPLMTDLTKSVKSFQDQAKAHIQDNLDRNVADEDDDILV